MGDNTVSNPIHFGHRLIQRTPEVKKLLSVDLTIVYSLISFPRVMVIEVSLNHKMYASIKKLKYD